MADDSDESPVENSPEVLIAAAMSRLRQILEGTTARAELSEITGIPAETLKGYFLGRSIPSLDRFLKIIIAAGIWPSSFFGGDVANPDPAVVTVPVFDAVAAAGLGRLTYAEQPIDRFAFPRAWIQLLGGSADHVQAIRAEGDSMLPTIAPGALMIVDRSKRALPQPQRKARIIRTHYAPEDIFVFFERDEGLRVKRLNRVSPDIMVISSDNRDYAPEIWDEGRMESAKIIGRVIWWDNRL